MYPDCFPPAGGDELLSEFSALARERGWRVGTFCNGTRWVTGHRWTGYQGDAYYEANRGPESVSIAADQQPWKEGWDTSWRPSYACCSASQVTSDAYGYAHEPGRWMTEAMGVLIKRLLDEGQRAQSKDSRRQVVLSVEAPCNEYNLQDFVICDVRVVPEGHRHWPASWIPLYHYLYHECILIQGGFGMGPEPFHMPIRTAYNLVVGEIPGAVLTGDGRLLNYDTENWAPWEPYIGSNDDALASLRSATALRRGPARDWLVFGRMQRPLATEGIDLVIWEYNARVHRIPALYQRCWQAPDGRLGVVLANWGTIEREVTLRDARLAGTWQLHTSGQTLEAREGALTATVPPLGAVLIHQ